MRMLAFAGLAVAMTMFVPLAQGQPIVQEGLSVYYDFDEVNEDGFFLDESGNNLHGLITFGFEDANEDGLDDIRVEEVDVKRGAGAVHFDTDPLIKEDYIAVCDRNGGYEEACDLADDNNLIPTTGFTVAAWVKVDDVGADHSVWQSRAGGGGFIHTQVQSNGNVRFHLRGDANGDNIVAYNEPPGGNVIEYEEWFHYAGTWEKTDGAEVGEWAFYHNGEEVAGGESNGNVAFDEELEVLGNWESGAFIGLVPDFNRQLVGLMDEFYLFHRALNPDEITQLFELKEPGPNGDLNGSGALDPGDLDVLSQHIKDGNAAGDLNGDGAVDAGDRDFWIVDLRGSWMGDSNDDGEFNSGDLVTVFTGGKYETGEMAGYAEGDWNLDMLFDSGDLVAAFTDGGYERGPRAVAAVPEPTAAVLTLIGFAVALTIRRRA